MAPCHRREPTAVKLAGVCLRILTCPRGGQGSGWLPRNSIRSKFVRVLRQAGFTVPLYPANLGESQSVVRSLTPSM